MSTSVYSVPLNEVLVVVALPDEFTIAEPWSLIHTGIGKVNAAVKLSRALSDLAMKDALPKLVVNIGTAGSGKLPRRTVVQCGHFAEHDLDLGPLQHLMPDRTPISFESQLAALCLSSGAYTLHSGDHFVMYANDYDLVDMEGYALASVCKAFGVPFTALKYISDGSDDEAADHWVDEVKRVEGILHEALMNLIDRT